MLKTAEFQYENISRRHYSPQITCLPRGLRENTHFCAESGVKSGFLAPQMEADPDLSNAAARGRLTVTGPGGDAFMDFRQHAGKAGVELLGCTCPLLFDNPLVNVVGKPKVKAYAK